MQVNDAMTADVECLNPEDSIAHAAERMRDLNVGSMPVCGENDRLVGMITDRDITVRATADDCSPHETAVREVMTPDVIYCFEDQDLNDAAELMEKHQIRRLVVLNNNKRLVGIVSLGDIAVKSADERLSGEVLERISQPAVPAR